MANPRRHLMRGGGAALLGLLVALGPGASASSAAAPSVGDVWASQVQTTNARLNAEVNPGGKASSYHFAYITKAAYEANVAGSKDPFAGASRLPAFADTNIGSNPTTIGPLLPGLAPGTAYRYRLVVKNADGTTTGPTQTFATYATAAFSLPDGRGWELVSPVEKNGGQVAAPAEAGGGPFRAAAQGSGVAYASKASFAGGAGAAPFSQYVSARTAGGWATQNITPAHLSGAYEGAPYVAFATDLARALYLNPSRCPAGDPCPAGYRLRESSSGALIHSPADPGELLAASAGLGHFVFSEAGELRRWSPPGALVALGANPPAAADAHGAVSGNGQRIYYPGTDGDLHLREGAQTKQVDAAAGGGGSFEDASADGANALYSKAGALYTYDAATDTSQQLSAAGTNVLAGSARLGPDGTKALFASIAPLMTSEGETYDNLNANTKAPTSQVYLYDTAGAGTLRCVSCNPTHARPIGGSSVPGAEGPHRPRAISADGKRVFFESRDALVLSDVNLAPDVYRWHAQGKGGCARAGGCVALISAGLAGSSSFVDASAEGSDAYFVTDRSLVWNDPGSIDLYDARVGGGFPEPVTPPLCVGDACQPLPPAVEDPVLTTVLAGPGNPSERYRSYGVRAKRTCPKGKRLQVVRRKGKVVKRKGKPVRRCVKVNRKKGKRRAAARQGGRR